MKARFIINQQAPSTYTVSYYNTKGICWPGKLPTSCFYGKLPNTVTVFSTIKWAVVGIKTVKACYPRYKTALIIYNDKIIKED